MLFLYFGLFANTPILRSVYPYLKCIYQGIADSYCQFQTVSSSVHQMILQLEKKSQIRRTLNTSRSIVITINEELLPKLK
jgi:hypothetical protein